MKTRNHHIDLTEPSQIAKVSFKERLMVQLEMIEDHAWLRGLSLEESCRDWVEAGWAKIFADHYLLKNVDNQNNRSINKS